MTEQEIAKGLQNTYKLGFIDGLRCFAHWKDGVEYVGTCGKTLKEAIAEVETLGTYRKDLGKTGM